MRKTETKTEYTKEKCILDYRGGVIRAEKKGGAVLADNFSFRVLSGKSFALIGETGSGKTMTALSVMGLLPAGVEQEGGNTVFCGRSLPAGSKMRELLGKEIVYIPQNGAESLDPSRTVRKQMFDSLRKLGFSGDELSVKAAEKLSLAGFAEPGYVLNKYPFQLSGGMCQRVTIALAACSEAKLVIADEPSNGLDDDFAEDLIPLLKRMFPKAGIMMITHDISIASKCDDIAVLCGGRMMEKGKAGEVLASPRSPYTAALIEALPQNGMKQTPVLRDGTSPCPFYRRCREAGDKCRESFEWNGGGESGWRCISS